MPTESYNKSHGSEATIWWARGAHPARPPKQNQAMSESTAWGLGIGLVVFGPLLNFVLLWVIAVRIEAQFPTRFNKSGSWFAALLVVLGIHAALVVPGMLNFSNVCAADGTPTISQRVKVDTVYFDQLAGYEAESILKPTHGADNKPRPFRTLEFKTHDKAKDIDRYSLSDDGRIKRSKVSTSSDGKPELLAKYGVNKRHNDFGFTSRGFQTSIYEISTGVQMAKGATILFHGGWLSFLRPIALSDCPAVGTKNWRIAVDLPQYVLGGYEPKN